MPSGLGPVPPILRTVAPSPVEPIVSGAALDRQRAADRGGRDPSFAVDL
jgi:hypothetical protein